MKVIIAKDMHLEVANTNSLNVNDAERNNIDWMKMRMMFTASPGK